ncbi:TauD/TfdA family dioxygenase [Novosphingobium colocasiae]
MATMQATRIAALDDVVDCHKLGEGRPPLFIVAREGAFAGIAEATGWITRHRPALDALIRTHGGVVLRGFPLATSEDFSAAMGCFEEFSGGYQGGAAARRSVAKGVYEATQRTGDQSIPIHQEMFYIRDYPPRLAFFARKVAEKGGETKIADMRAITAALPPAVRDRLEALGISQRAQFCGQDRQRPAGPADGQARLGLRVLHRFRGRSGCDLRTAAHGAAVARRRQPDRVQPGRCLRGPPANR